MAKISIKNIAYAIDDILKDKNNVRDIDFYLEKIINFIKNKNLLSKSDNILMELENIINKENGLVKVKITVNRDLDHKNINELKNIIKDRFKFKDILLEIIVDKDIIGGIKLEINDKIIDLTHRNKLNKLKDYLIKN
jgi:F-type H+-transporting ATPase subunit delta